MVTISPLVNNTDRKGGAYPIILQQFRRASRVDIVRGQAKHKLARLCVRETAADAADVCGTHHSDNRWKQVRMVELAQLRNGYDFCVPKLFGRIYDRA